MNTITLPVYYQEKITYKLDTDFHVSLKVESNPLQLELDSLFAMAMRHNKKRGFLFVSKILGKHLAVDPYLSFMGGAALAAGYLRQVHHIDYPYLPQIVQTFAQPEKAADVYTKVINDRLMLPDQTLFIGFAETATALGYSIFNCFAENCAYIHTTRELIPELKSTFNFEEEHSHAVAQRCYSITPELFSGRHPIVFVDDELTTGKTVLNFIREIQRKFPRREYAVLSILDWRSEKDQEQFRITEQELGIKIQTFSLLSGTISVTGKPGPEDCGSLEGLSANQTRARQDARIEFHSFGSELNCSWIYLTSIDSSKTVNDAPYLLATGRFGISWEHREEVEKLAQQIGEKLKSTRQGSRVLCLGTGEFMYVPMRIASHLGEGVVYHSTTRSPIRIESKPDYIIRNRCSFPSPEDPEIINYLYNIPRDYYDELYIFLERDWPDDRIQPLRQVLSCLGIPKVNIVIFGPSEKIGD